jgi:hypothetical protein
MTAPSVDLDKIEALAKAAISPKCTCCASGGYRSNCACDQERFEAVASPAVVLQWVAETRAKDELIENIRSASDGHLEALNREQDTADALRDKLRVAVEALETLKVEAITIRTNETYRTVAQRIINTTLATLSGHVGRAGGEGEKN